MRSISVASRPRPGAEPVSEQAEIDRVVPVIHGLADAGVPLSVDTRRASVMYAALDAGARIINDVSALTDDAHGDRRRGRERRTGHSDAQARRAGGPCTTIRSTDHVTHEVFAYLRARVDACVEARYRRPPTSPSTRVSGSARPWRTTGRLLAEIAQMHGIGCPVMVGASRKVGARQCGSGSARRLAVGGQLGGLAGCPAGPGP